MPEPTFRNLDRPDELLSFPGISGEVVEIGGMTVARTVMEPGWRWSTHIRPTVGGDWCRARHVGILLSGRVGLLLPDGTEYELVPNTVYEVPPGHDGFVIGDEPAVQIEWSGVRTFAGQQSSGVLVTLLFTDLVDSTSIAARLGDGAWREMLGDHYESVRNQLDRFGGREDKTTGDGVLAVFDSPAAAVRCAAAIREEANRQDLHVRAGVHIGEVQVVSGTVQGVTVHEAARVMAAAGTDEILVSEATRALALGSGGLTFEDRGTHELKGLPGARRLYAAVGT